MIFKRFYHDGLAQASYLIGCDASREAVVVDPNRDVAQYEAAAESEGLRIGYVAETHIHADFVSGSRELASRCGAALVLSAEGGRDWQYAFARSDGATLVRDGHTFAAGQVRFDVLHTPGHTPEHLAFLVTDGAASNRPVGLLSGDFVFVGDVGRPDLLERAVHVVGTMEAAARALFQSLRRFRELPDFVQVWPGHGAGSACGKALGAMPQSTVGYEKLANWGVAAVDEDAFVRAVLAGQPDPPPYFAEMKHLNRDGPPVRGVMPRLEHQARARLDALVSSGDLIVDTRPAERFAGGHIPGTLSIPLGHSFVARCGALLPYDRDLHIIADSGDSANAVGQLMSLIGLDRVAGWFGPDALDAWASDNGALECVPQMTAAELASTIARGNVTVVDVRDDSEWAAGHIVGALHVPLGRLVARIAELPSGHPVVVHCQGGSRSAIAASILRLHGLRDVSNLRGGFREWVRAGHRVSERA